VVAEHAPDEAAVEATFVNKDASADLSSARPWPSQCWCGHCRAAGGRIRPNLVKKTIVGAGHCEKAQIA